jgi:hypothetical protein
MNIANKVTTISYFLKDTVKNKYVYAKWMYYWKTEKTAKCK